jgi:hypothetical protein
METCNNRWHIWNFIRWRQYLVHQLFQCLGELLVLSVPDGDALLSSGTPLGL